MALKTMLATLGESWKGQWLAEGKAKGRAEGKAEGRVEGKAELLMRLAERRFGPLPDVFRNRIRSADEATIETWADRLMDAPDLDAVFCSQS